MNEPQLTNNRPRKRARYNGNQNYARIPPSNTNIFSTHQFSHEDPQSETLFFPNVPKKFKDEKEIRKLVEIPTERVKVITSNGRIMAWVTFGSIDHCHESLIKIKNNHPNLAVSIHREQDPRRKQATSITQNRADFNQKCERVLKNGGLGNTLLFRKIPRLVESDEFMDIVNKLIPSTLSHDVRILRIRTAVSRNIQFRNFWCIFSNVDTCRKAFESVHRQMVNFRCGVSTRLMANVHDDSTDADGSKRISRSLALGGQTSKTEQNKYMLTGPDGIQMLESFLRQTQQDLIFIESTAENQFMSRAKPSDMSNLFCCPQDEI